MALSAEASDQTHKEQQGSGASGQWPKYVMACPPLARTAFYAVPEGQCTVGLPRARRYSEVKRAAGDSTAGAPLST